MIELLKRKTGSNYDEKWANELSEHLISITNEEEHTYRTYNDDLDIEYEYQISRWGNEGWHIYSYNIITKEDISILIYDIEIKSSKRDRRLIELGI